MTSTSECPTCGDEFSSDLGVKQHHAKTHGESIAGEPVDCTNCGSTIRKKPNRIEEWDKHFCGDECRLEYTRGESHHQYERISLVCDNCGDEVEKRPSRLRGQKRHFCDMSCRDIFYEESGMLSGENNPRWKGGRISSECKFCGDKYEHIKSRESTFCSKNCKGKWMSENLTGEDAYNWKGGYEHNSQYYGNNWDNIRMKIIKLDNNCCRGCGDSGILHVHHVIPIKTFDDVNDANYKENLVTLCPRCHSKMESLGKKDQIERLNVERLQELV